MWPNARYIHLVRDPRDVAASIMEQGRFGCHWHAANHWHQAEEDWEKRSKSAEALASAASQRRDEIDLGVGIDREVLRLGVNFAVDAR